MLEARAAGAVVRRERLQGKGHVVRRMFADIDADVYVLVDGDDTYDAAAAPGMLRHADRAATGHGQRRPLRQQTATPTAPATAWATSC